MPTYEYACRKCDHQFEVFQSIKADPLSQCPSCGDDALRRLIGTGAGIIFKGSGFYETDYKRTGSKNDTGSSSEKSEKSANSEKSASSGSDSGKSTSGSSSSASKSDT